VPVRASSKTANWPWMTRPRGSFWSRSWMRRVRRQVGEQHLVLRLPARRALEIDRVRFAQLFRAYCTPEGFARRYRRGRNTTLRNQLAPVGYDLACSTWRQRTVASEAR
jgi:hypothetical protein